MDLSLCDPFEDTVAAIDDSDMDNSELSEWLSESVFPQEYEEDINIDNRSESTQYYEASIDINVNMFDEDSLASPQKRRRISSPSPPLTLSRQLSSLETIGNSNQNQSQNQSIKSTAPLTPPSDFTDSMKKIEFSQLTKSQSSCQPASSTLSSLAGLLAGKRTSLTEGLEHSRKQLRAYMSLIRINQL